MTSACTHIIDDDEAIRDALQWLFKTRGVACRAWPGGEAFVDAWRPDWRGCIVLDIRMAGMSGLECFDTLLARGCTRAGDFHHRPRRRADGGRGR